jgi:hypothetical protein
LCPILTLCQSGFFTWTSQFPGRCSAWGLKTRILGFCQGPIGQKVIEQMLRFLLMKKKKGGFCLQSRFPHLKGSIRSNFWRRSCERKKSPAWGLFSSKRY